MRTFGCIAYVRVDPEKSDKLDAELVKCYLVGYDFDMFGYKFWDVKNKRILRYYDVTFDENVMYKDKKKKGSGITKQVGVEVGLRKNSLSDVVADIQGTLETADEEPEVEQVARERVLKRSSKAIRVLDMYVSSLHYLLLTDKGEPEPFDNASQLEDTTKWEYAMYDGCLEFRNALLFHLLRLST